MCTVCGCGAGETKIDGHEHTHADGSVHANHEGGGRHVYRKAHVHEHIHADGTTHSHNHEHMGEQVHEHGDDMHFGQGAAHAHAPGLSQARMVQIERDILSKNNEYASKNRQNFHDHGIFAINLVSSPGSGKTTLLTKTIQALKGEHPIAVVEGDQQTSNDAERIRATGVQAIQINTGKGCHLDAHMVGHAVERLNLPEDAMLMIENVGNLVCPAAFDLGEAHKVVILSVTEGEDKPLKYPDMFEAADIMLLNKVDLLPYLQFNVPLCIEFARRVNPQIQVIPISSFNGEGMDEWLAWLRNGQKAATERRHQNVEVLRSSIAKLEAELAALKGKV